MAAPTLDDIRQWPATCSLGEAAAALGYSKAWAYELAASGEFPAKILQVRSRKRVVTASLLEVLSTTGSETARSA
jgi:hypothetical protein